MLNNILLYSRTTRGANYRQSMLTSVREDGEHPGAVTTSLWNTPKPTHKDLGSTPKLFGLGSSSVLPKNIILNLEAKNNLQQIPTKKYNPNNNLQQIVTEKYNSNNNLQQISTKKYNILHIIHTIIHIVYNTKYITIN